MIPGEIITKKGSITLNEGKETITIKVANTGDRAIQVGSHYHFYETNEFLSFERNKAKGFRLNIPSGSSVRFEPGQIRDVIFLDTTHFPHTGRGHARAEGTDCGRDPSCVDPANPSGPG